jgi:hypothetical protein
MSRGRTQTLLLWLCLAVPLGMAQTQAADAASNPSPAPEKTITVSTTLSADGGRERFAVFTLERGDWLLQNIDWSNPSGDSILGLFVVGRRFKVSRRLDLTALAGPWYSYENHAWDEVVLGARLNLHGERFRLASSNYWGVALRRSGYFFALHNQTLTGLPHLPDWLGLSLVEKYGSDGLERLFVGPSFAVSRGSVTLSAFPYWDIQHRRLDMQVSVSFSHSARPRRAQ